VPTAHCVSWRKTVKIRGPSDVTLKNKGPVDTGDLSRLWHQGLENRRIVVVVRYLGSVLARGRVGGILPPGSESYR